MSDTHKIVDAKDLSVVPEHSLSIMHPMVERMMAQSPTPETLRELMALQREWEAGNAKRAFTRALVEMRRDLPAWIKRDKIVTFGAGEKKVRYTHASLAAAIEAVLPALNAHGFSLAWTPATQDQKVSVTATLTHRDGHSESATLSAPPDASGAKSAPQAIASTVTLLQRYTALAILGIATSDMEEPGGNGSAPAQAAEQIDSARNLRAMSDIGKAGRTREQAEAFVGQPIQQWTSGDLAKLKEWVAPPAPRPPSEAAEEPEMDVSAPAQKGASVTPSQMDLMKGLMKDFNLTSAAFATLIASELGHRPASLAKVTQPEYEQIARAFKSVLMGEWSIKDGRFDKPPQYPARSPEDDDPKF